MCVCHGQGQSTCVTFVVFRCLQELVQVLNRKAYKTDVHRALQAKADKSRLPGCN